MTNKLLLFITEKGIKLTNKISEINLTNRNNLIISYIGKNH